MANVRPPVEIVPEPFQFVDVNSSFTFTTIELVAANTMLGPSTRTPATEIFICPIEEVGA
jgi:hypothetical protein